MIDRLLKVLEHLVVYDRFTYDDVFRFLLSMDYDHETANEIIVMNCNLSALVFQERIYNKYYRKITLNEKISEDLELMILEEKIKRLL